MKRTPIVLFAAALSIGGAGCRSGVTQVIDVVGPADLTGVDGFIPPDVDGFIPPDVDGFIPQPDWLIPPDVDGFTPPPDWFVPPPSDGFIPPPDWVVPRIDGIIPPPPFDGFIPLDFSVPPNDGFIPPPIDGAIRPDLSVLPSDGFIPPNDGFILDDIILQRPDIAGGPVDMASACLAGHYSGPLTGAIFGTPMTGTFDFTLGPPVNNVLPVVAGTMVATGALNSTFNATLSGSLDCGTKLLTGSINNGVLVFQGQRYAYTGTWNAGYNALANRFLNGSWLINVPQSPLGPLVGNGTWQSN